MSLTGAKVDAGLDGVKLSLLDAMGMDLLSGLMGVVLAVVGASVCGGGGVALVGAGPVGMIAGAYSSLFVAAPLLAWLREREPDMVEHRERLARRAARAEHKRAAHEALPANTAQSKCDLYVIAG